MSASYHRVLALTFVSKKSSPHRITDSCKFYCTSLRNFGEYVDFVCGFSCVKPWICLLSETIMTDVSSGAQSPTDTEPIEDGTDGELPAVRVRKCTEKAQKERIRRLKAGQTTKLSAVTKKRNALTNLMAGENNLHLVKTDLVTLNTSFQEYQEAYELHYRELISEDDQDKEFNHYETKEKSFLKFRKQVMDWIVVAEHRLAEQFDLLSDVRSNSSGSSKASQRSKTSVSSSTKSARAKEKGQSS